MNHVSESTKRGRTAAVTRYVDLCSAEVTERMRDATLVLPVGSIEQHGPHLPLSVDFDIAEAFAEEVATAVGGVVMPTLPIGARSLPFSGGGLSFPGTVYVPGDALLGYFRGLLTSLLRVPMRRLVILNAHYENEPLFFETLDMLRDEGRLGETLVVAFSWWSFVRNEWFSQHGVNFPGWHAEHAGLTETSLMMYLRPEVVRALRPEHACPPRPGLYVHPVGSDNSTDGVLSSTRGASAALGEALYWHVVDEIANYLRELDSDRGIA